MKTDDNPMHPAQRLQDAPRCTTKAKRTGCPCNAPAVKGWAVCRMHGARSGAPSGRANGMWRHGGRGQDVAEIRRLGIELSKVARGTIIGLL
jgi:hypothetical protein